MTEQVKWGLLATGAIAQAFARGVKQSETGELYAVASRDLAKSEDFAAKFGATKAYGSYEEMLADPEVEAVYVSTPHPMHLEWVMKSLLAGKHVLCEKPAGVNQWELQRMLALAEEKNLFFMEAYMYRCHPQITRLVELIEDGAIGRVCTINAAFSFQAGFNPDGRLWKNAYAGGGIMDVGGYPVSLARLIAAAALKRPVADPVEVKGAAALHPETGVDAWASAVLKFENDIIATVSTGVGVNQENVLRVFGTAGNLCMPAPYAADRENPSPGKIILNRNGKDETIDVKPSVTTYALEADVAGRAIRAGRIEAPFPAMGWADSIGNLRTQDQWRATAGLTFENEKRENYAEYKLPIPLAARADAPIPRGTIKHLDKPVSRLIMGVDNQATMPHADAMFSTFFEHGGNTFDTAYCYGDIRSRLLGTWINANNLRDQVVIIAKGAHTPDCFPPVIRTQLLEQLDWYQTDYADLYMMHRDNPDIPAGEFIEALNELTREGRIRAFGGSNWSLDRVAEANAYAAERGLQGFSVVSNNLALAEMVNPVWGGCLNVHSAADRQKLLDLDVALLPWSSQARGFFIPSISAPSIRNDASLVNSWYSDDNFERQARAVELARTFDVEPINIALAWVLCQKFPCFPLIGPRTLHELLSCLAALRVKLTDDEMAWLNLEQDATS